MGERSDEWTPSDTGAVSGADRGVNESDPEAIREEIEETRSRMSGTLDDIGERLNPQHVKEKIKHEVREATIGRVEDAARNVGATVTEASRSIMDTVRENPIPAAMVGIGLGWLIWNSRQSAASGSSSYRSRHPDSSRGLRGASGSEAGVVERARERAGELAGRAQETVGRVTERAQETAGLVADRAQQVAHELADETRHAARRVEDQYFENPLAMGAAALALGLATGLAIPETRAEHELMGAARDRLLDRGKEVAEEAGRKVEQVVERVFDETGATGPQATPPRSDLSA